MRKGDDGETGKKNGGKKRNKTWSSVSNSSLVRPRFWSKTNLCFKKLFGSKQFVLVPKILKILRFTYNHLNPLISLKIMLNPLKHK